MFKTKLLLPVCLLIGTISFAQPADTTVLRPQQYKNDLYYLKTQLQSTYPSLYRFNNEPSVTRLFDSCYNAINEHTTTKSFYGMIKYITGSMGDGHLGSSAPPALWQQFDEADTYFPLSLLFIKDSAYVNCSNGNNIQKGATILSINGIPINDIKNKLFQYLPGDGRILAGKYTSLSNSFFFYYSLVYGDPGLFDVRYKENSVIKNSRFKPTGRKNIQCDIPSFTANEKLLNLRYPAAGVATLCIQTFSYQAITAAGENFPAFMDSAFTDIKKNNIKTLIIDLRNNGGGTDVYGALLYSYLTSKSFKYYAALHTAERQLTEADHPNLALQQPNKNSFNGKLLILINGDSFSASAEFCSIVKSNNRGIFIGEETGGTYIGNTSGGSKAIVLPYTKININIPTTRYTMAVEEALPGMRGIIPQYPVIPSFSDMAEGNDVQLKFALRLATK